MQAVILAAGASSRFYPLNSYHKSLIKILGEPIITHTIRAIKRAGITDVVLVTGPQNEFIKFLGNGKKYGVRISYATLSAPSGAGDGLLSCKKLVKSDFFFVHPYQFEFDNLKREIDAKRGTNQNVILLARPTDKLANYGGMKLDGDRVLGIIEKPKKSQGLASLRIVGVYFLNQDFMKVLAKTPHEHYSFERALDVFAKQGRVRVAKTSSKGITLKYPWDLLEIKNSLLSKVTRKISKNSKIAKSAQIIGNVVIDTGVEVEENAIIKGPAYIGKGVYIGTNSLIRNNSDIEEGATIGAFMELKNSLVLENSKTHAGFIGDSVIGANCRIGTLFSTANVRLDRTNIKAEVKGEKIDTDTRSLGIIMGDDVTVGERVSSMPGVVIGNNVSIGPSTTVMHNIPSSTTYYTKFSEFISKKKKNSPAPHKK